MTKYVHKRNGDGANCDSVQVLPSDPNVKRGVARPKQTAKESWKQRGGLKASDKFWDELEGRSGKQAQPDADESP